MAFRFFESQLLIDGTSILITVTARLLDHIQYGCLRSGNRGCALANIHALRTDTLSGEVIGSGGASLDSKNYNSLSFHVLNNTFGKHSYIRANWIPDHIRDTKHGFVRIFDALDTSVIIYSNIDLAAIRICKGNYSIFDIIHVLTLKFCGLILNHKTAPVLIIFSNNYYNNYYSDY